ncbi:MAG: M24 family metallopeptidase [Candidatus Kerfeldbacteria bacterium]|nr:M24 family metallopeptidase [Candidatus Kerfeldbacteria bacterium]
MGTGPRYNLPACRRAADITYQAFRIIPRYIVAGMSERQLAWRLGRVLANSGSQQRAFSVIAAFGSSAAEPHHVPTNRCLRRGDMIKLDAGAVYQQMRGDVTRTYFFGSSPSSKFRQRYQAVLQAQQLAFTYYRAGNNGQQIDAIARQYLKQRKFHHLFIHSLGHGVGRAIHQPPFLTPRSKGRRLLQVGDIVTNEPGVYEPGWGGVRIEDMVEITAGLPRWLGQAPRQLRQITLG